MRTRARFRFQKGGDLRFLGHHDLLNCFERMLRRAELPVAASQGFNPKPRLTFALSLPLGIVGRNEVLEIDFSGEITAEDILDRLVRQSPAGLEIHSARLVANRAHAQVRRAFYRVLMDESRHALLAERVGALLASEVAWVRRSRPQPRRINIRPFIDQIRLDGGSLVLVFWVSPYGTARLGEVLELLGLGDLLDSGIIAERSNLEIIDEIPAGEDATFPDVLDRFKDGKHDWVMGFSDEPDHEAPPQAEEEVAPRPSALVPGPLSFDS
jgi:radical SAM-linked protein